MRAIGIILAGGNNHRMKELSQKRAIGAMPIAGSYRSIDFSLSNMSNSNIKKVAVFTQYNARSLNEHLSSSKWWDFGRKQGGLTVFTPAVTAENSTWYRGTADSIYQNLSFLKSSHEPYAVIASGDCVYKMDYNKLLEYHIQKKADITVVCKDMPQGTSIERFGTIKMNEESRIEEFEEKPIVAKSNTISCGIYVIRRRLLIEMIERCAQEDRYDFVKDVLIRYKDQKRIFGYKIKEYWKNIASVEDYFQTNMDFLKADIREYNVGSKVKNSLISSGCIINGEVENSVVFKKSFIGNNCVIKNSIILNDVYIGDNSYIENCIVESRDTIKANSYHRGEGEIKIVVEKNDRYMI